ncbi:MAG: DUF5677 domain-containing protein [Cytophagales bacterium]|nr:DUF5677 domain-containing protein [Cytophagales bacterium]
MKTKPIKEIIPREIDPDFQQLLNNFSVAIDELVNFGSRIIKSDMNQKGGDEKLPAILFLRNFVEIIDSISILVKHSSIDPCKSLLRTAFESNLYISYLLEDDMSNRAISFLVWNTHRNLKLLKKLKSDTPANKNLQSKFKKDKFLKSSNPIIIPEIEAQIDNSESILALPKYKSVNEEYEKMICLLLK